MVAESPAEALGPYTADIRDSLIGVVQYRHERAADAHLAAESRYGMGFGTQWRDLLDDTRDTLVSRGFQTRKLKPAGYDLPVVNDALVYVWRVPDDAGVGDFASSPTRKNGFTAAPPHPMLFEPAIQNEIKAADEADEAPPLEQVITFADTMPLVLVMVHSSPRGLQSIEWAIAVLDDFGKTKLLGLEEIWTPELSVDSVTFDDAAFDSGTPVEPVVELQEQEETPPDA